jgi:hypothetical protein
MECKVDGKGNNTKSNGKNGEASPEKESRSLWKWIYEKTSITNWLMALFNGNAPIHPPDQWVLKEG